MAIIPVYKPVPEPLLVERYAGESIKLFYQNQFTDCVGEEVRLIRRSSFPVAYSAVTHP